MIEIQIMEGGWNRCLLTGRDQRITIWLNGITIYYTLLNTKCSWSSNVDWFEENLYNILTKIKLKKLKSFFLHIYSSQLLLTGKPKRDTSISQPNVPLTEQLYTQLLPSVNSCTPQKQKKLLQQCPFWPKSSVKSTL